MAAPTPPLAVTNLPQSLAAAESFPCNIIDKQTYVSTLAAYKSRLDDTADNLFCAESDAEVCFRDFDTVNHSFVKENVWTLDELDVHLGVQRAPSTSPQGTLSSLLHKDPKCRFMFVLAPHSRAALKVTRRILVELLTYHQVLPDFLEFILLFGQTSGPANLRFTGFREQSSLNPAAPAHQSTLLGRSGRQFEICYNLKTVNLRDGSVALKEREWNIRQACIHHKFDVVEGTALWTIVQGSTDLKERIQHITGKAGRPEDRAFDTAEQCFESSLAVHVMATHWAGEHWRWYIQWLEDAIEAEAEPVIWGIREKDAYRKTFNAHDLQSMQTYEDKVAEAAMAIDSNMEVITALREYYDALVCDQDFPLNTSCQRLVVNFVKHLKNACYDLKMQSSRAKLLIQRATGRKELILQWLQAQAAEKMEGLTHSTVKLGICAQEEAVAMRIITVVTLIYLPATFVSTFFSTDVVKYQPDAGGGGSIQSTSASQTSYSNIAMYRWLQVTIPLTVLTLAFSWTGYCWAKRKQLLKVSVSMV